MATLFGFMVPSEKGVVKVRAALIEDTGRIEISLGFSGKRLHEFGLAPPVNDGLLVPILDIGDELIRCLATCLVGVLVHHILECWNGVRKDFITCLKNKGITIGRDAFKCVTRCVIS